MSLPSLSNYVTTPIELILMISLPALPPTWSFYPLNKELSLRLNDGFVFFLIVSNISSGLFPITLSI